ncbi:MAG: iron ABC transporter permease [Bryobacteraceae bacterium]|nr:iron ABC transporter permease [Bryobacteraceae bacterium]
MRADYGPHIRPRVIAVSVLSLAAFLACAVLLPLAGSVAIDYSRALSGQQPDNQILFSLRVPRVLLALISGGALSLSGLLFQALLRDALATPYTLGVSSGAALGAVFAISLGLRTVWPASVIAAVLTLVLVVSVAMRQRTISPFTLLMTGVTINSICTAGILFLHSTATFAQSITITRWLMGGIEATDSFTLTFLSCAVILLAGWCFQLSRQWNLLAVGEDWAAALGVDTQQMLLLGYLLCSVLTGAVTAFTGPIGFVGLIVPHALRMSLGADHRILIPSSFFLGGAFLALCDTVARTALAPAEIPVGVITAIIGGPFFIWLLRKQ